MLTQTGFQAAIVLILSYGIVLEHPISFTTECIPTSDFSGISTHVVNRATPGKRTEV